ncbi:MAG: hypothetical protein QW438_00050 [Ignisphaera sp.]|uniref:Uncharacterized protein n=1 Tax=Ignisphaera aggregans TaxID=334771 RepID=A0A7J3I5W8_9CREN
MVRIPIRIEHTYSRTGKHHRMSLLLLINPGGGMVIPDPRELKPCRGVYINGFAYCGEYSIPRGYIAVSIYITYGLSGRNRGYISILNDGGYEVLRLKYVNNTMRKVSGDDRYKSYALIALNNIHRIDEYAKHR